MAGLKKFTLRLDPADVAVLKSAYPRTGYNQPIRAAVHKLAMVIVQKKSGSKAPK